MVDQISFNSKSDNTSKSEQIIVRETKTTRIIVNLTVNTDDVSPDGVKATLEIARKKTNDSWDKVELDRTDLRSLRFNSSVYVMLNSEEYAALASFFTEIKNSFTGMVFPPSGRYIHVDSSLKQLSTLLNDNFFVEQSTKKELLILLAKVLSDEASENDLLEYLIQNKFKISSNQSQHLLESLSNQDLTNYILNLDADRLKLITNATNLKYIQESKTKIIEMMGAHLKETEWQDYFVHNPLLLSLIIPFPLVLFEGQPYFGGKAVDNKGGSRGDFFYRNVATHNCTIIEIKTPDSALLAVGDYRNGAYPPSPELSSALIQTLNYKHRLLKEYTTILSNGLEKGLEMFYAADTPCILLIGNTRELDMGDKTTSFELFRRSTRDVIILTFDELVEKINMIIELMDYHVTQKKTNTLEG